MTSFRGSKLQHHEAYVRWLPEALMIGQLYEGRDLSEGAVANLLNTVDVSCICNSRRTQDAYCVIQTLSSLGRPREKWNVKKRDEKV